MEARTPLRVGAARLSLPERLTDSEWTLVGPLIPPAKTGGRPRDVNVREVLNAIFYVLSAGANGKRYLPPKSIVHYTSCCGTGTVRSIASITRSTSLRSSRMAATLVSRF